MPKEQVEVICISVYPIEIHEIHLFADLTLKVASASEESDDWKMSTLKFEICMGKMKVQVYFVLIGKLDEVNDLLNYFLIIAKWHIWMSRKRSLTPDIAAFKEVINMKYKTEKYIGVRNNTQRKFQARWKIFIDK